MAQWLHRIAHRFEGSKADRFNNLVCCGTSHFSASDWTTPWVPSYRFLALRNATPTWFGNIYDSNIVVGLIDYRRAETVVNSLLLSPKKIKNVTVTATARDTKTVPMLNRTLKPDAVTIPWYNDEEDIEGYYYWMTPSLDYEIKWETVTVGLKPFQYAQCSGWWFYY